VGPPKALIVGLDVVWCDPEADSHRITFRGFPDWLYEDDPWKGVVHLFNYGTVEIAARLVGYHLGLYPERIRYDGYEVFVPPEAQYDALRAHENIWRGREPPPVDPSPPLTPAERRRLSFPALPWLDAALARLFAPELNAGSKNHHQCRKIYDPQGPAPSASISPNSSKIPIPTQRKITFWL
jgi:hypothetical protein